LLIRYVVRRRNRKKTNNRFSLVLIVLSIICFFSSTGYPSEWCFVASSKTYYYYVDSEIINAQGKDITFWIVQQDIETGKALYKKRFTINCEDETVAMREVVRFGFPGTLKDFFLDERYDEWVEILPHSKMHAVQNVLCCDSKPRKNITEYLQRTTVKKEELRVSSDVLSDKH
jgi:hypothetical protein